MALTKRGKTWHCHFVMNGQRFRQSLGTRDWREAQAKEKDLIARALTSVALSALARLRTRAESFGPVEPTHYVFAAFVPKFTFSGSKVVGYDVTGFDPTTHIKSWRTAWRSLTKKAGLPGFRFHDLRHCAITQFAESGAADSTIMAVAGHVSRRMLERYSHVRMEAKRAAMKTLANSSRMKGYDTDDDTNAVSASTRPV
jgi:integrase